MFPKFSLAINTYLLAYTHIQVIFHTSCIQYNNVQMTPTHVYVQSFVLSYRYIMNH